MNSASIKELVQTATSQFKSEDTLKKIVTDFHIKIDNEGTIVISDDEDNQLVSASHPELVDSNTDDVANFLRATLVEMNASDCFQCTPVFKPFSFLFEDAEGEIISELLIVDDDNIILTDNELLKGLDEELDEFLAKLLAD